MINFASILNNQTASTINWEKIILKSDDKKNHFLLMLSPLMEYTFQTLLTSLTHYNQIQGWIEENFLSDLIFQHFQQSILRMIIRSTVLEMHFAKENNLLEGETSEERFNDFIQKIRIPKNTIDLLNKYALLKNQIDINLMQFIAVTKELFERLNTDKPLLLKHFFMEKEEIKLIKMELSGDTHQQGHSVSVLEFSIDNKKVNIVYKPHPLNIDIAFQRFIEWFNQNTNSLTLKTVKIINRNDYGWCEFIDYESCKSQEEVHQFFYRFGIWLALIYLFRGYDFHGENLIAHGAHPVAIDFECLMTPSYSFVKTTDNELSRFLVSNIGFLPAKSSTKKNDKGIDLSALGSEPGNESEYMAIEWEDVGKDSMHAIRKRHTMTGFLNKPRLSNQTIDYMDYETDFTQGFVDTYQLLLEKKSELLSEQSPLNAFKNARIRIVMRLTRYYAEVLNESWHPKLLYNKKERKHYFRDAFKDSNNSRSYKALIKSELKDLNQQNIPVFTAMTDGHILLNSFGKTLPIQITKTGFDSIKEHIALNINKEDLLIQKTMIKNSFSIAKKNRGINDNTAITLNKNKPPLSQEELHSRSINIIKRELDYLTQHAFTSKGILFWPTASVTENEDWFATTTSLDSYSGILGIGLTFLYASAIFNDKNYQEMALRCLQSIQKIINNKEQIKKIDQIGAFNGIGSILYALSVYYRLLKDPSIKANMVKLLNLIPKLIQQDEHLDIIGGSSGLIVVLLSLQDIFPKRKLMELSRECVQHILEQYPTPNEFPLSEENIAASQPLIGVAHGASGIFWALHKYDLLEPTQSIKQWMEKALAYERDIYNHFGKTWPDFREVSKTRSDEAKMKDSIAWCHGATGIGLTRLDISDGINDPLLENEINRAIELSLEQSHNQFPCLCHGNLGTLELLFTRYQKKPDPELLKQYQQLLSALLESMNDKNFHYSPVVDTAEPGLMTGRAGIAYQLMRMTFPDKVPSVLLLKPNSEADTSIQQCE